MILITTVEHGIAAAIHDITVGAKATAKAVEKVSAVVAKDAPVVETLTALVDPRAAVIERLGAAILGEVLPQIDTIASNTATETTAPTVSLSVELFDELKSLASSLASEITGAKATVAASTGTVAIQAAAATPIRFTLAASPDEIRLLREQLRLPVDQAAGTLVDPDVDISWQVTPAGIAVAATPVSFKAKLAEEFHPGTIEAKIRSRLGE